MPAEGIVTVIPGREKPIINQHPWIFSGAIAKAEGAAPGEVVAVISNTGHHLGRGLWNHVSQIQVRMLTFQDEAITETWWRQRLQRAIDARRPYQAVGDDIAYRLINAENDFLPGLIVDRYGDWLVLQALTLGIERRKFMLAEMLADLLQPKGIYERSDVDVREREGLKATTGVLWGEAPPETLKVRDTAGWVWVDLAKGHKTGLYLDQAENRGLIQPLLSQIGARHLRLLNVFSYTGGFGLGAFRHGGTSITNVDSSADMLKLAERNFALNAPETGQAPPPVHFIQGDAFEFLRDQNPEVQPYDVVILDPPKFAHNKQQVDRASRGYKDLNLHAFQRVKAGGYLLTFSCSGAINADLFQKIVFGALADSGRSAQIVRHLGPGPDHPVALTFPEGAYLKGLMLRVY